MALPGLTVTANRSEFLDADTGVRTRFGAGIVSEVGHEVERLSCERALILSTPQQSDAALMLAETIGLRSAGVFTKAAMHTPVEISAEAVSHAQAVNADCVVSMGGGSTIGLGKAIAFRTDLPQITIPTTYAGSEATPILGQTEDGVKTTLSDGKVLPEVILYDPELVRTLPVAMSITSGLNAMAHAVEALYAQNRGEKSTAQAIEGLEALIGGLPQVISNPGNLEARQTTQYGAWLCGTVLGKVGMALHHKLCHTLGGSFDLPHAETHAVVLPHAVAYNERSARMELEPLASLLGKTSAAVGLYQFSKSINAPMALKEFGLKEKQLDRAAELAVKNSYWNPHPVDQREIRDMLQSIWSGDVPAHLE